MAMTIVEAAPGITGGVDTHLDTHVAAALDPLGRLVGTECLRCRRRRLQGAVRLARGLRRGDEDRDRRDELLWHRAWPGSCGARASRWSR